MKTVFWKLHLQVPPDQVYSLLATDEGRAKFWAESAIEKQKEIHFLFPNGQKYTSKILREQSPDYFEIEYFQSSVIFYLKAADQGTILTLTNQVPDNEFEEISAGWVSVLMNLKAFADFGVDLRNHQEHRTWDQRFVNN